MPPGVPVAAVGLDAGENAGLLALQILALSDKKLEKELKSYRTLLKKKVLSDAKEVGDCDV
jgi:5-(carboxyamino)imidazole ribonucleotide mutase